MISLKSSLEYEKYAQNMDNVEIHAIWNIPNFKEFQKNKIEKITTPEATETIQSNNCAFEKISSDDWKFQFKIEKSNYDNTYNLSLLSPTLVFLKLLQLKTFAFNVVNWDYGEEKPIITNKRMVIYANKSKRFATFRINESSTIEVNDNIILLKNGSLRLKFELVITCIEIKSKKNPVVKMPASQLINDFENLLIAGRFSDFIMKSTDGEEFRVHKAVIASRSPVLQKYFEHNTVENTTNIVETAFKAEVLRELLLFIYTDKSPNVDDIAEELLVAADYYQLNQLKSLCEETLYKKLDEDSAIELLLLADRHSANKLAKLTLEFIKQDFQKLNLITKTEGWAKLQSVDLLRRICE